MIYLSPSKGIAYDRIVHWRRPREFLDSDSNSSGLLDPEVLARIEPTNVVEGALHDTWFLCALSILAERPALIERLFVTK